MAIFGAIFWRVLSLHCTVCYSCVVLLHCATTIFPREFLARLVTVLHLRDSCVVFLHCTSGFGVFASETMYDMIPAVMNAS